MNTMMDLRNALRKSIDERITATVKKYSGGQCSELAMYKLLSGRTLGLAEARELVDETFSKLLDETEEE